MVLTLVAACFLVFTVASLGAAVGLGSNFFDMAAYLVVVTSACLEASVTGLGLGLGLE
jgi:hypothetical protein